jgi:hypothetical protein
MIDTAILPRPFSCHVPKIAGYEPSITCEVVRISRSRRNGWRATVLIDKIPMAYGHCPTKEAAESWCSSMMIAYTNTHYNEK